MTDSRIVYVDANPIIYAIEGTEDLAAALRGLFTAFKHKPGSAVTSELTLAEVLPKRNVADRTFLELLVWSGIFDLRPITRDVLYETADYRRLVARLQNGTPKLPDAIHVVTAIKSGCTIFLSADSRIRLPDTIRFVRASVSNINALARELS
jgi:predicted nucleic acid-binding protein